MAENDREQTMVEESGQSNGDGGRAAPAEFGLVREVLEGAGLAPRPLRSLPGYSVDFRGDGPGVGGVALIDADHGRFVFFLEFVERGLEASRADVAEFVTRINYGLGVGNFEMNYETVEVRFKTAVEYAGDELRDVYVRNAIVSAMSAVEAYADLLCDVMQGRTSAKAAAEAVPARPPG